MKVIPIIPVAPSGEVESQSLYEAHQKIYPRSVTGLFARWRWAFVWLTQIIFYGLPWLEWGERQAVLFDLGARRFYLLGQVLYPQDFIYLTGLLVISALVVDGVALAAIAARISELGFTPNRVAALGENLILLVNLAGSAWLYARFMRRRGSFAALERWQMAYMPVYSVWAALVVIVFPPVFGYR